MHSENIIWVGLDNWISFSRDREWTSIKIGVHLLLILSFFLILVLINLLKVKENIFLRNNFNKGFCVKGDWLNLGLSKVCDMILRKEAFFNSSFLSFIWFGNQFSPPLGLWFPPSFSILSSITKKKGHPQTPPSQEQAYHHRKPWIRFWR